MKLISKRQDTMRKILMELEEILERAKFADTWCNSPDDRMYHAEDKTWWKRVENKWIIAGPPEKKKED